MKFVIFLLLLAVVMTVLAIIFTLDDIRRTNRKAELSRKEIKNEKKEWECMGAKITKTEEIKPKYKRDDIISFYDEKGKYIEDRIEMVYVEKQNRWLHN